jgi:ubiquinone/menaquinone biosynthesis C-methylase UbiE
VLRLRTVSKIDLYNTTYGNSADETYREVRLETYGQDFGQTSWTTLEEFGEIIRALELHRESSALEIGSGAGGCAIHFAETVGCHITGLDVNSKAVQSAATSAQAKALSNRANFLQHDVSIGLPFEPGAFDAIYSNDAFCHIPNRPNFLRECLRVLKPRGRIIFSDALVITGALSNEELAIRTSIGYFLVVPQGENEHFLKEAGFQILRSDDTTPNAAAIAKRWHDARARRKTALVEIEGEPNFSGLQRFLLCAHALTSEKRLSRFLYLAAKP